MVKDNAEGICYTSIMESNPPTNEGKRKLSFDQMHELLIIMGEESKRRLKEQKTFEPGEREMYERSVRQIEAVLMNSDKNRNN
jgi:hypothetical protein